MIDITLIVITISISLLNLFFAIIIFLFFVFFRSYLQVVIEVVVSDQFKI